MILTSVSLPITTLVQFLIIHLIKKILNMRIYKSKLSHSLQEGFILMNIKL